ncbi:MAG TPA: hypothetical protein PKC03_08140 [Dokdonella sp.]|nr:hypothetical protein [Dokdonella sp.]
MPMNPALHARMILLPALAFAAGTAMASFAPFESEPVLGATTLVQPSLMSGPGFQVDPHVEIRGYMAHFTLDTPVGPLQAESVENLADHVAELPALEALEQDSHSQAFIDAAGDSATRTAKGIGQVLRHPIDTLTGIPAGVARYFGQRLGKIGRQAQSLSDRTARELGSEGNPYPRADGPMTETREIDREEAGRDPARKSRRWYDRAGAETEREVKRQIKYGQVKRELAERLGIDPYTSNPYLRERLDELAWAGSGGRFAASAAIGTIGGVGGLTVAYGSRLNELVWKLDPEQLRERNAQRLNRHCSDALLMRQFLRRGVFTPTLQTALVDALDALRPAAGGDALLELAMTVQSDLEARYLVNSLKLVGDRLGARAHAGTLRIVGSGFAYDSADGERILPLPVDYLAWTDDIASFIDREEFRDPRKTVLVTGTLTMRSQQELTARGWNIVAEAKRERADGLAGLADNREVAR